MSAIKSTNMVRAANKGDKGIAGDGGDTNRFCIEHRGCRCHASLIQDAFIFRIVGLVMVVPQRVSRDHDGNMDRRISLGRESVSHSSPSEFQGFLPAINPERRLIHKLMMVIRIPKPRMKRPS